jgi:hypothetical protein
MVEMLFFRIKNIHRIVNSVFLIQHQIKVLMVQNFSIILTYQTNDLSGWDLSGSFPVSNGNQKMCFQLVLKFFLLFKFLKSNNPLITE